MTGSLLVDNIGELVTNVAGEGEGGPLGIRHHAAVLVEAGRVAWIGPARYAPAADRRIDADGAAVLPGFVDSHAHLVFAGDRAAEFAARMAGQPYTGGGIRTTVGATRAASDGELRATVHRLRAEAMRQGTTTMEIKSGYGLTVADEARSLRIAAEVTDETTFLGAHVVPAEYADRPDDYVGMVCGPMLAAAAPYARWIDVFCERGAFDVDHARAILACGQAVGLGVRLHANQLGPGPGVRLGVELGAASVDHCTHLTDADIEALASTATEDGGTTTVATLLPGAEFSTRSPYPDARRLLDAGVTVALATDCNPGSSYTSSMPFCIALAVREMRMTPAEAVWA
ncbi:MAG: imidazolonepropionase, partial [Micromonospora sp.]